MSGTLPFADAPAEPEVEPDTRWTERKMLDLLAERYNSPSPGNGPRYVIAEHVRSHAGFDARRTADFMAQDLWPSSGLALHGHEVKVSRSDWLTELKDPTKADEFRRFCDFWWLVVPDKGIVRDDLPAGWGLLVAKREEGYGHRLRVARPAPRNIPEPLPRTLSVSLLRASVMTARRKLGSA